MAAASYTYQSLSVITTVIFNIMLRIIQWLDGLPQIGTPSWKKPKKGRLSRSASCPVPFPPRTPSTAHTYPRPQGDARSMAIPTNRTTEARTPATTTHKSFFLVMLGLPPTRYIPQPPGTWCSVCGYPCRYPFFSTAPLPPGSSEAIPPHQSAHLLELTGRGNDHDFRDLRSPWLAWQRERSEKEKYYGFRFVKRGDLLSARRTATPPQPTALYRLAQEYPRPPKNHHRHIDKVTGTLSQRVDRRREERKHRKAILKDELEDFRLETWPRNRRRGGSGHPRKFGAILDR
jgi:hypothetical protein